MNPSGPRTDHEILIAIHDKVQTLIAQMDNYKSVLYGKEGDSHDVGLVARVVTLENENYDERVEALETFVSTIQPLIKALVFILGLLATSIIAGIWALITGQAAVVIP
jgi:hypothetical protein